MKWKVKNITTIMFVLTVDILYLKGIRAFISHILKLNLWQQLSSSSAWFNI